PGAAMAASPSPVPVPALSVRPVIPPKLPIPPGVVPGPVGLGSPTPSPAAAVPGPVGSGNPTPSPAAERWLQNHTATTVWADPDGARALAPAAQWSYFRVVGAQVKVRIPIFDPRTGAQGWVDAATVGPSGA